MNKEIKLTQTVQKGGCAAKVAAAELRKILDKVKFPSPHPQLMVDGGLFDDAAIYRVHADLALVQTLDFFTPIVDSPYLFGQIAATNALSDVYAMGGVPKTAMAILGFPLMVISPEVVVDVLQGASDKIQEARANFVGGHSIDDDTLKFGLSVTGFVHPEKIWTNANAKVGDYLILTKALGTGAVTAALKRQVVEEKEISEALQSMSQLNNVIDFLSEDSLKAIHSATDVTGFGLLGHSLQMAKASGVGLSFQPSGLPVLPRAMEFLENGYLTKAHRTNREYVSELVDFGNTSSLQQLLMLDPQTSGGLLLAVSPDRVALVLKEIQKSFASARVVGRVLSGDSIGIRFNESNID